MVVTARHRVGTSRGSRRFRVVTQLVELSPGKSAVVICDMWNSHWCRGATRRVEEMAPRMNEVIKELRGQGMLIIHAPSATMDTYSCTTQRSLARSAPKVVTNVPLKERCRLDLAREPPLPIDDSDTGCACRPRCEVSRPWSSQVPTLEIEGGDAITDSVEAYYLMKQRGIVNMIIMGVHTNICVLGRPFAIRQMVYQGTNVFLMRDMTDAMYNPRRRPYVGHFRGTDLVIEHIEKYWCPTITSDQVIGGKPFRFKGDRRGTVRAGRQKATGSARCAV